MSTRLDAYRKILDDWSIDPEDDSYSGAEDAKQYLTGETPLERYCVVTLAGEFVYAKANCPTFDDAKRQAVEFIDDDTFAEMPSVIVDLDTGKRFVPRWKDLNWDLSGVSDHADDCATHQHPESECTCGLADRLAAQEQEGAAA